MLIGGMTQAESPEWMPASSICSITDGTNASYPSAIASASLSIAFSRIIDQDGAFRGDINCGFDVLPEHCVVSDDFHAASAEHKDGLTMSG